MNVSKNYQNNSRPRCGLGLLGKVDYVKRTQVEPAQKELKKVEAELFELTKPIFNKHLNAIKAQLGIKGAMSDAEFAHVKVLARAQTDAEPPTDEMKRLQNIISIQKSRIEQGLAAADRVASRSSLNRNHAPVED